MCYVRRSISDEPVSSSGPASTQPHSLPMFKPCSGLTLTELMVTICVIGILAAVVTPNVITWRNSVQFNNAVREVKGAMERMRITAIRTNLPTAIQFTDGTNTFVSQVWDRVGAGLVNDRTYQLSSGIRISTDFGADLLQFNNRGMANNGIVTIQNSTGLSNQIVVSIVGSTRIQ